MVLKIPGMLLGALLLLSVIHPAAAQSDCPLLVRTGLWEIVHDKKIKTTVGIFPGNRDQTQATLSAIDCGKQLDFTNGADVISFFHEGGDKYASKPKIIRQSNIELKIQYLMTVLTAEKLSVKIDMSGKNLMYPMPFAGDRGTTFTYKGQASPLKRIECECDELDKYIQDRIQENEKWRDLYSNPQYWEEPQNFSGDSWKADKYELLLNEIDRGKSYDEAVDAVNQYLQSPQYTPTSDASSDSESPAGAATDTKTCELEVYDGNPGVCFPALYLDEVILHESMHRDKCLELNAARKAWSPLEGTEPPRNYRLHMNIPENAGVEEARAYQAAIDFLKDWKDKNCGT